MGNSTVPIASSPASNRKIWKVTANTPITLNAGTYWVKYQLQNIVAASAGFLPPVTIVGNRGLPSFNAKQMDGIAGTWASIIDLGNPATAPDYPVDMPFVITYIKKTLGTSETLQYDNRVRTYPNPANNEFRISIPKEVTIKNIEIYDASGRLVKTLASADVYNISDLKAGIYSVKVNTNDASKVTRLIVK